MTKNKTDGERLLLYDRLVRLLSKNCPLGDKPSPEKIGRWRYAYNALFDVAAAREGSTRRSARRG